MDEKKTYLINIESNLNKYAEEAVQAKEKVEKLTEANNELINSGKASKAEIEASNAALRDAKKEYNNAKKMVDLQTAANNAEAGSRKQLEAVLRLEMYALGKLGQAYITNAQGLRELNPLYIEQRKKVADIKQAIIDYDLALNDGRSNVGRYGESVKTAMGQAGSAFKDVSSAIGGVVGSVGDAVSSFITAGGPIGVLTAAIALLAKAWKTTQENIELYLKSADKLSFGPAGFERDASKAMIDFRKRAEGQVAEGMRIAGEANNYLLKHSKSLTDEQRKYYQELVRSGEQMMINGRMAVNETYGIKNKHEWERKYNALLIEQETIADKKLAKETEWEALEARITEQRMIAKDKETSIEKAKAAQSKADEMSLTLGSSKIQLINEELDNIMAIAEMTGKQEEYEDRINALIKERYTIQKEYYSNQIKIEKFVKDGKPGGTKDSEAAFTTAAAIQYELDRVKVINKIKQDELAQNKEYYDQQRKMVEYQARVQQWETDQYIYNQELKRQAAIEGLSAMSSIFGEQTEAGKMFAAAAATIDTYGAANKALNDPLIPSTIARIALMTGIILRGLANVKQIYAVKPKKSQPTAIASSVSAQRITANQVGSTVLNQPQLSQTQLNALPQQGQLTIDQLVEAFKKLPAPITTIEDINARTKSTNKIMSRANI